MQKLIRGGLLSTLKPGGIFDRVRDSKWRQSQLLILCYHSLALDEENLWRPANFLTQGRLRDRFEMLKQGGYNVLQLGDALERLRRNDLPPRSVVLTFDDGTYDFYKLTYPLLKEYGFPATIYQTTYYCSYRMPVFSLVCSYMLWKKRDAVLRAAPAIGIASDIALGSAGGLQLATSQIVAFADSKQLSTEQKNELAAELAARLDVNYDDLSRQRILQLMTPGEIAELAAAGIDFELHTHRHRMPRDRALFEREIRDNREALEAMTKNRPVHFCYPSGDYDRMFLPWLTEQGVVSATTCDPGLASVRSNSLLLPRFVDTTGQTALDFESWLSGVGAMISLTAATATFRDLFRSSSHFPTFL
jgi:peptidoglycan/xylan/chitin deacetylase (PgdA/CDA1 family)